LIPGCDPCEIKEFFALESTIPKLGCSDEKEIS